MTRQLTVARVRSLSFPKITKTNNTLAVDCFTLTQLCSFSFPLSLSVHFSLPNGTVNGKTLNEHEQENGVTMMTEDRIDHNQSATKDEDYIDSCAPGLLNQHRLHVNDKIMITTTTPLVVEDKRRTSSSATSSSSMSTGALNCCMLCNAGFNLLLNRKCPCKMCEMDVCRNCATFDDPGWICSVCDQQR